MCETVIEAQALVKYYGGRRILNEINLKIPQGCIYGLLGRNGVGKTTLIRILMGLETPTRGFETSVGRMTAEEDIVDPPVVVSRDGMIAVPEAPGIGQDIVWPRVERATLFKETWTRS